MNLTKLITIILDKKSKIFQDNEKIYILNNKNLYQIILNENILNISIKLNNINNNIFFSYEEYNELLMTLFFLNKRTLKTSNVRKKYKEIKELYIINDFNVKVNQYINIIENEEKIRTRKELCSYKKMPILYLFAKHHDIDLSIFDKIEPEIKSEPIYITFGDGSEECFNDICLSILKSKQIVLDNNKIFVYYGKNLVEYNFNNLSRIVYNGKIIKLDKKQINFIFQSLSHKDYDTLKKFFINNKINNLNILPKLIRLGEEFSIYNKENCKIKIVVKKVVKQTKKTIRKEEERKNKHKIDITNYSNDKNARVKKEEIFTSNGFGTLGELLGKKEVELKNEFDETENEKAYFKPKLLNKKDKQVTEKIESLVLWDMENIHYHDDFSTITRYVKNEKQLRVMCFNSKFRHYESINRLNFILDKLKKRNWIVKETKKIADNMLIEQFHKYKNSLKELIVISNDSDFRYIVEEANDLNIKTLVLHRHGREKESFWYNIANENISLKEIVQH